MGYSALQTLRTYKIRNDVLIISIIGGIAGVIDLAALIMGKIEEKYETWKKNMIAREKEKKALKVKLNL